MGISIEKLRRSYENQQRPAGVPLALGGRGVRGEGVDIAFT
jgi:hypothetical protein